MKHKIDMWNINKFQRENKLIKKDLRLLLESFRRKNLMGKDVSSEFLGLGTPSEYKSQYFTASFSELPRVSNWYKLTTKGEEMMLKMEEFFDKPANYRTMSAANEFLFSAAL